MHIEAPSRAVGVVRYIEQLIEERGYQPGDRIATKSELQQETGVARATLNEAVRMLHDRGQIVTQPGPKGGLFVAQANPGLQLGRFLLAVGSDPKAVADAVQIRDFLEELVVIEATRHRSDEDIAALAAQLEVVESFIGDPAKLLEAIFALHEFIASITPNALLESTYCGLAEFVREQVKELPRADQPGSEAFQRERVAAHRELVEVIIKGDLDAVSHAIQRHNTTPGGLS